MKRLIIATTNQGKLKEFKQLLSELSIEVLSMNEVLDENIEIIENGKTFEENALIKAQTIMDKIHEPVLADDSGLEIDYLNKEPGIYSARYLGHDTSYDYKNKTILKRLENVPYKQRDARFVCALALCIPNKEPVIIRKTFEGKIHTEISGNNGFGYDPIFYYPPLNKTSSEMTSEEKNQYSHRGQAMRALLSYIKENQ